MAYDAELAERVRDVLVGTPGLSEKKMFGGLAFLVGGRMAVTASGRGGLLLRVDPAANDLIDGIHVHPFVMRGREMHGWLGVDPEAVATEDDLERWVALGITYAASLPPK
ncbi:TfoX/Sxy family protein [Lapillicoccus sp.]|uniref:TfoX/Sxy family protein n=1 Tax=Lapillicoccus sp. TaxID=1909287 RepID=UPI0025DD4021|nr:TfoX/Sxy family protein [Lapillicoccus sp.]